MANYSDLSPTAAAENQPNFHPSITSYGVGWVVVVVHPRMPLDAPPQAPRAQPAPSPADPPALQLPLLAGRVRNPRQWTFRYRARASHAPRTPLNPQLTGRLQWLLCQSWLRTLQVHVGRSWLLDFMALHIYLSLFGGVRWRVLQSIRIALHALWPRDWPLPHWVAALLDSNPC